MRTVRNVHERVVEASADTVGALMDRLSADDDPLFPTPAWPPMRFDRPLGVGADGGHGFVRYKVGAYRPGRSVRFDFAPPGNGFHGMHIEPLGPARCRVVHVLEQRQSLKEALRWSLVVRPVHDVVVEELLDNIERAATGSLDAPVRWSPRVRLTHRLVRYRPRAVAVPEAARLARGAFDRVDFCDAWQLPLEPGMDRDPRAWRGVLPFAVQAADGDELLLGEDASHLDFRASLLVGERDVTLTTVVRTHNRLGRLYFAPVRYIHPFMVRWMLRRTYRALALAAPSAAERSGGGGSAAPEASRTAGPPPDEVASM
ncbi:DUF2867 domain-containing protein [Streptomyces sp. NPDC057445]|uniref:DUF2867 domain-containing protein n=1 Tax=Streptomyces sp. NPDC057445 TaxID=3346136 RepID=UPI00367E4132